MSSHVKKATLVAVRLGQDAADHALVHSRELPLVISIHDILLQDCQAYDVAVLLSEQEHGLFVDGGCTRNLFV